MEGICGLSEIDKRASERIQSAQVDDSAQQFILKIILFQSIVGSHCLISVPGILRKITRGSSPVGGCDLEQEVKSLHRQPQ